MTRDIVHEAVIEGATQSGCGLIFMASHGRRGNSALLLGSETHKVLMHSKMLEDSSARLALSFSRANNKNPAGSIVRAAAAALKAASLDNLQTACRESSMDTCFHGMMAGECLIY